HLVDAVEDLAADQASGAWNPLLATGTGLPEARRLCDDSLLGIKLALDEAEFTDDRLVRALLVGELTRSVHRTFAKAGGTAAPSARARAQADGSLAGRALAVAGLAGVLGMLSIRRRHGCCECSCVCCCDACGDGCCDCSC